MEVMDPDNDENDYSRNIHVTLANILSNERLYELEERIFQQVENDIEALMSIGDYDTLQSFSIMLNSPISLESFCRFLHRAVVSFGLNSGELVELEATETDTVKNTKSIPNAEYSNGDNGEITAENKSRVHSAFQMMREFPRSMGQYDGWLRQLVQTLNLNDGTWQNDSSKIRAIVETIRRHTTWFSTKRRECFLKFAREAPKMDLDDKFYQDLHDAVAPFNKIGYKWGNLRCYGGWPGLERLELRMNTIARQCFGYDSWHEINEFQSFHAILAAMTPPPIWKAIMDRGFDDAHGYFNEIMSLENSLVADPVFLRGTFGIPFPDEVDLIGMGTLRIHPQTPLDPKSDTWVNNVLVIADPSLIHTIPQSPSPLIPTDVASSRHGAAFDDTNLSAKWGALRSRGGWPGFRRLSSWMDILALELFREPSWKLIKDYQVFKDILGAVTPPTLWWYITKKFRFDDVAGYFDAVMKCKDLNEFSPEVLKAEFGIPLPSEVDRVGFGTLIIHPLRMLKHENANFAPRFLNNPLYDTFIKPKSDSKPPKLLCVPLECFVIRNEHTSELSERRKEFSNGSGYTRLLEANISSKSGSPVPFESTVKIPTVPAARRSKLDKVVESSVISPAAEKLPNNTSSDRKLSVSDVPIPATAQAVTQATMQTAIQTATQGGIEMVEILDSPAGSPRNIKHWPSVVPFGTAGAVSRETAAPIAVATKPQALSPSPTLQDQIEAQIQKIEAYEQSASEKLRDQQHPNHSQGYAQSLTQQHIRPLPPPSPPPPSQHQTLPPRGPRAHQQQDQMSQRQPLSQAQVPQSHIPRTSDPRPNGVPENPAPHGSQTQNEVSKKSLAERLGGVQPPSSLRHSPPGGWPHEKASEHVNYRGGKESSKNLFPDRLPPPDFPQSYNSHDYAAEDRNRRDPRLTRPVTKRKSDSSYSPSPSPSSALSETPPYLSYKGSKSNHRSDKYDNSRRRHSSEYRAPPHGSKRPDNDGHGYYQRKRPRD